MLDSGTDQMEIPKHALKKKQEKNISKKRNIFSMCQMLFIDFILCLFIPSSSANCNYPINYFYYYLFYLTN
jgi:hypothetical protein